MAHEQQSTAWLLARPILTLYPGFLGQQETVGGSQRWSLSGAKLRDGSAAWSPARFPGFMHWNKLSGTQVLLSSRRVFWSRSWHGVHIEWKCKSWLQSCLWLLDSFSQLNSFLQVIENQKSVHLLWRLNEDDCSVFHKIENESYFE